ncbi:type 12 methyltransferase [Novosphingobium barchaimii LL02]|uniref:Type 12 methyltransferase n=1 Tax=Novosphingobium barchaimii LL02 TaxID=1114963 RepID=A0A0J8ANN7_9SPHN|nr:methyltransferase domain-containing protein [Novosphingobium barchaimii]KMS56115.1 type 12 methyltransferase [Novosphingobium barchaimii LL02]
MDAANLDVAVYGQVLHDLARVNRWTFTARPVLAFLARAVGDAGGFSMLDVGFGHGDTLRAVARWATRRGIAARLAGVDLNPASEDLARGATPEGMDISYATGDYADQDGPFDFIVSSQVAHHMSDAQLDRFVQHMEHTARRGWMIGDLHRHRFAYHGFPLLARAMGVHRIVREDGQLSIARSLRPGEWPDALARAGLAQGTACVERRFPFRISVERTYGR